MRAFALALLCLIQSPRLGAVAQIRNVWAEPAFFCPGSGQSVTVHFEASKAAAGLMGFGVLSQDGAIQLASDYGFMYDSFTSGTGACPAPVFAPPIETWRGFVTLNSGSATTFQPYSQVLCLPAAMSGWSTVHVLIRLADSWSANAASAGDLTYDLPVEVSCSKRLTQNRANFWYANTNTVNVVIDNSCAVTPSRTATRSFSPTPSLTRTPPSSLTSTPTYTLTSTRSFTLTVTPSYSSTSTLSPSPTPGFSLTVSSTFTSTNSITPGPSPTSSSTRTVSPTSSVTPTVTSTPTGTSSVSPGPSSTGTASQTETPTATLTATVSSTPPGSFTETPSRTQTSLPTNSFTPSQSPSMTPSLTQTPTPTPSPSFTFTPSASPSAIPQPFQLEIKAYNSAGEEVKTLYSGGIEILPQSLRLSSVIALQGSTFVLSFDGTLQNGSKLLPWGLDNDAGQSLSSGVYLIKAEIKDRFGAVQSLTASLQILPAQGPSCLRVYNSAGEELWQSCGGGWQELNLAANSFVEGGKLSMRGRDASGAPLSQEWDGKNSRGEWVAAGSYQLQLQFGGGKSITRSFTVLKAPEVSELAGARIVGSPWRGRGALQLRFGRALSGPISLRLYTLNGELALQSGCGAGSSSLNLEPSRLAAGIYVAVLELQGPGRERKTLRLALLR